MPRGNNNSEPAEGSESLPLASLPPIMSVAVAAEILDRSDETVCGYIRRGELVASGLGTDKHGRPCAPYAILAEDLVVFLQGRRLQLDQETADPRPGVVAALHTARRRRRTRTEPKLVDARRRG